MRSDSSLAWATVANIMLSHEKNTFYIKKLKSKFNELIVSALGQRFPQLYKNEINAITDGIYHGASAISGSANLGDQYADLLPVSGKDYPPPLWRRIVFVFCHAFGAFGVVSVLKRIKKSNLKRYFDESTCSLLHSALFYFDSCYYYVAYRIAGIRFKLMRKIRSGEKDAGYALLGVLSLVQLAIQLLLKPIRTSNREDVVYNFSRVIYRESEEKSDQNVTCMLCLSIRRQTVATPCGHLFCWYCIADWVAKKPECPLCRTYVVPPQLIPVHSY